MISNGVDINWKWGEDETTAIHEFAKEFSSSPLEKLLSYGPDLDIKDKNNNTALTTAIKHNNYNHAEILVKKGAKVDKLNIEERDDFILEAVKYGNY